MREHIAADEHFERTDVPVAEAIERFRSEGQDYKVELIEDLVRDEGVKTVSLYRNGPFTDLCRGPHGPGTKRIKAFKLTSVAGAYWRGDADRQMLTRVYGTAFPSKEQLDEHLHRLEQARERDHRRLGRELGLFMFSELSPGSAFWLPRGTHVWNELTDLWRAINVERGYTEVRTPILYDVELWKRSGHWDVYRDNMYFTEVEERAMGLKPMNCPGALPDLQARAALLPRPADPAAPSRGIVHRHEPSGTLHGLLRVRQITQDDAHVFCTEEQIEEEAHALPRLRLLRLQAVRARAAAGAVDAPREAGRVRRDVGQGGGGPAAHAREQRPRHTTSTRATARSTGRRSTLHITDAIGRSWQLGTVQLDYYMPERFDLAYTGADNAEHRPVMIHRALIGSFERFIGILIEHYGGEFPLWLAPVQAIVLPIADRHVEYAERVATQLREAGLRVEVDERSESIGRKIREAEVLKVPYMLVVGDAEQEAGTVAVRRHREGDLGSQPVAEFARAGLARGCGEALTSPTDDVRIQLRALTAGRSLT